MHFSNVKHAVVDVPQKTISVQGRWKVSVQNLIELATMSLTERSEGIKWLRLSVTLLSLLC